MIPRQSMECPLSVIAQSHPSDLYLQLQDRSITFADLHHTVISCSQQLQDHPQKIPFAILGSDPHRVLAYLFAAARTGRIIAITSTKDPIAVRSVWLEKQGISSISEQWCTPHSRSHPIQDPLYRIADPHAPLCILFTSGSSGQPKAVVHSFASLWSSAIFSAENIAFRRGDRWLLSLSLWHIGGLMIPLRALYGGASIVEKDPSKDLGSQIDRDHITHLSVVATQLQDLLKGGASFRSLKAILVGGGMIPPRLVSQALMRRLPIHTTYGMTELSSQLCTTPPNANPTLLESAGSPLGDWKIRIGDHQEIQVSGSPLFLGYWDPSEKDHPVYPLPIHDPRDADGFFATGDTGIFQDNRLYPTGRVDQMFISGGENIYPEEIEQILSDVGIFAIVVPIPHERYGARPIAFIHDSIHGSEITTHLLETIQETLQQRLPKFKHPDHYLPWPPEIPLLKPPRKVLRERALQWISTI